MRVYRADLRPARAAGGGLRPLGGLVCVEERGILALPGGSIFQRRQQPARQCLSHVPLQTGRTVDKASLAKEGAARAAEGRVVFSRDAAARPRMTACHRKQRPHLHRGWIS